MTTSSGVLSDLPHRRHPAKPDAAALAALVIALGLCFVPTGTAATPTSPVYDGHGNLIGVPFVPAPEPVQKGLTEERALQIALGYPKVRDWVQRYEGEELTKDATFDQGTHLWTVKVWAPGKAGEIVLAKVDDRTQRVTEAWTGPQVAWKMARGYRGAFGLKINDLGIWLGLCGAFLLGLVDWRRPFSLRTLDLLVLLSFSVSLWYFNEGDIFTSVPPPRSSSPASASASTCAPRT